MAASDQRVALNDAATRLQGVRAAAVQAAAQTRSRHLRTGALEAGPSWAAANGIGYVYPEFVEQVRN